MRNILSITSVASLAIIVAAGSVSAQTTQPAGSGTTPHSGWMSIGAVTAKLEGQGYVVREIETDDGVYEVKALDKNGARVEADLDPVTGEAVRGWNQDD